MRNNVSVLCKQRTKATTKNVRIKVILINIVISHGDIDNFALSVVVVYCVGKNAI